MLSEMQLRLLLDEETLLPDADLTRQLIQMIHGCLSQLSDSDDQENVIL